MTQIDLFVTHFHKLEGITIAERTKNLFALFNQNLNLHGNDGSLDTLTAQLQPHTDLEHRLLVEFWIYFRRHKELAHELFVNENPIVVKKIKNQKWFFEQVLAENHFEFINQIVSTLSYSLTLKVLKNILPVLKEQEADAMFDSLLEIHGISLALHVITSCTCTKIEETLKNFSLKLQPNQLKILFDKDPSLLSIYLEEREKYEGNTKFMDGNPVFGYIAQKDVNAYQDLCLKYDFKVKLGKRVSCKVIAVKRQDILTHPELYVKNLHPRCLIKKLGPDFSAVYLKLFPKTVHDSPTSQTSRLLQHYPKNGRYNLVVTTYNQIFAKKLEESPHLIDEYILQMIQDPKERERLAKLNSTEDPDLKYYSPESCFKIIKEKINFARQPYERGTLVTTLVQSCTINDDYNALLEVAKFVTERFKNDTPEVQEKFLQVLLWQKADFSQLKEEHWDEINKILARPDLYTYYDHTNMEIFYRYIEFLYKTDKPVEDEMRRFFKKKEFNVDHVEYIQDRNIQKKFLRAFIEIAPDVVTDTNSIENLDCHLVAACFKYNSKNRTSTIDVFYYTRLLNSAKSALENKITVEETILAQALEMLLCTKRTDEGVEDLRKLIWSNMQYATPNIIKWFVKHRPEFIENNVVAFLSFALESAELNKDARLWRVLKYYSHLSIVKKCVEFCSAELTPQKCNILSHLLSKEEFLSLVESHRPDKSDFVIQMALLNGLKNINSPVASLSLILQFCEGDYEPLCLRLLYDIIFKLPKNHLESCIANLKEKSVVTKHAYHMISLILKKDIVLRNLEECHSEYILTIVFKNFLNNPSEEAWRLFVNKLNAQENFDSLTSTVLAKKSVPLKYKVEHFEYVWTVFHEKNNKYKRLLLKNAQKDTISKLKLDFMHKLIEAELFKEAECNRLVSVYIIASAETNKVDILRAALDNYKKSEQFSIKSINDFVNVLLATYMEWDTNDDQLMHALLSTFEKKFHVVEIFEEYVILSCMKFKGQVPKQLSESIIQLHNNLIARYGETITGMVANILKKIVPYFYKTNVEKYQLYYFLLTCRKSVPDILLVTKLLPTDSEAEDKESDRYYELVLHHLQELNLGNVQLYLNLYFKCYKIARNISYYERINNICLNTSSWLCPGSRHKIGYNYY